MYLIMSDEKKCKTSCCSNFMNSLGILLTGVAAVWALHKSDGVIDKILELQKQSTQIEMAVNQLGQLITSQKTLLILSQKNLKPEDAIEQIPTEQNAVAGQVFLPINQKSIVIETLASSKPEIEKAKIIENALKIKQ